MNTHATDTDIERALRPDCVGDYRERRHWQDVRVEERAAERAERLSIERERERDGRRWAILAAMALASAGVWGVIWRGGL